MIFVFNWAHLFSHWYHCLQRTCQFSAISDVSASWILTAHFCVLSDFFFILKMMEQLICIKNGIKCVEYVKVSKALDKDVRWNQDLTNGSNVSKRAVMTLNITKEIGILEHQPLIKIWKKWIFFLVIIRSYKGSWYLVWLLKNNFYWYYRHENEWQLNFFQNCWILNKSHIAQKHWAIVKWSCWQPRIT